MMIFAAMIHMLLVLLPSTILALRLGSSWPRASASLRSAARLPAHRPSTIPIPAMPSLPSDAATAGAALNQHMSGMLMEAMFDGYSPQTDGQAEHTAMRSLVQQISSASGDRIPEVLNALLARPAMGDASRAREQLMDPLIALADQLPSSLIPVFLTIISHLQYKFSVPEHREIVLRALGLLSRCSASDEHTAVVLTAMQTLDVRLADLPPDITSIVLSWYELLGHDAQGTAYRVQYLACLHAERSHLLLGSIELLREDVQKHLSVMTQSSQGAWHLLRCLAQLHASSASTKEEGQREEGDRCEGRAIDLLPADRLSALFTQSLSMPADAKAILGSLIHWQALGGSFASLSSDAVRVLEERLLSAFDTMDQRTFRLIEQALQALGATREALSPKLTAAMDELDGHFRSSSSTEGTEQLKRFAVMMRNGRVQADPQFKVKIAAKVRALIALMPSGELMTIMKELRALVGIAITSPVLASELIQPLMQLADRMPRMLLVEYIWSVAGCMYQFKDSAHRPLVLRAVGLLADLINPTDLELTAVQDSMKKMHIRFGNFPDTLKAAMLTSLDAMQRDGHGTETALRYLTAVLATCDHLPKETSASLLEDAARNADYFLQSSHKAVWVLSALSRMHFQVDDLPVDAQQFIANVFAKSLPVPTFWLEERKAVAEQVITVLSAYASMRGKLSALSPQAVSALDQHLVVILQSNPQALGKVLTFMATIGWSWSTLSFQFQAIALRLLQLEAPHLDALKLNVLLHSLARMGVKWADLGVQLARELRRAVTKMLDPSQASTGIVEVHRKYIVASLTAMGAPRV